jgi:hypothetical protein
VAADPTTRSTADSALKEFYLPGIRNILNSEVFLLTQMQQNTTDIEGRRAVLSINTSRNAGIGARAELDNLPDAGHQGYNEERIPLKYNYGRIQLSGPVIRSMGSDQGSFTRAVTSETAGVTRDLKNDVNRQLYADGSGKLATVGAVAGSTSLTITGGVMTNLQKRQLQVGMRIDAGTAATPNASFTARRITAINTATGVITLDAAVTTAALDILTVSGAGGTGAAQREVTGLTKQIAATGALWNIDPATVPNWASYVDDPGSTRAITEALFMKASQTVNMLSGNEINLWVTTDGVMRAYAALLSSLKRYNDPTMLAGGFKALDLSNVNQGNTGSNSVGMVFDKDCPDSTAFGLCTERFSWYKMSDWEFMQEDGAVLNRVANQDGYEATLFCYAELATDGRNSHAKIGSITEA